MSPLYVELLTFLVYIGIAARYYCGVASQLPGARILRLSIISFSPHIRFYYHRLYDRGAAEHTTVKYLYIRMMT